MAQPLPNPPRNQPLLDVIRESGLTTKEFAAILQDGAEEAERLIPKLIEQHTTGGKVKAAQLAMVRRELAVVQSALWGDLGASLRSGVGRAAVAAAEGATDVLRAVMSRNGLSLPELEAALRQQAQAGIAAVLARSKNGIPLSRAVYRTQQLATGMVDRKVNRGLLLGMNAKTIAKSVRDLIRPDVAGGVSYAAFRLARTEINHAYQTSQAARYADEPWTSGMKWNLSKSHPTPDICNVNATQDLYGLGSGVYTFGNKPESHPQCLCYQTPEQTSEDDFVENFLSGEYDDYLDEKLGVQKESAPPPPVRRAKDPGLTGDAALASVPRGLPKRGSLKPAQRKALRDYESAFFGAINGFLRRGAEPTKGSGTVGTTIRHLDEAMAGSALPKPVQTWRGMQKAEGLFGAALEGNLTGYAWLERGYGSTSTERSVSEGFLFDREESGRVQMRVFVAAGTKALQVSGSTGGNQAEIMLERGTRWRVIKDYGIDPSTNVRLLDVEVSK